MDAGQKYNHTVSMSLPSDARSDDSGSLGSVPVLRQGRSPDKFHQDLMTQHCGSGDAGTNTRKSTTIILLVQ